MKLALVCSAGGHFYELYRLDDIWRSHSHFWVTAKKEDTEELLSDEPVYWSYRPTERHLINLCKNFGLAFTILRRERPDVLISTGAGVGVPFIYVAKLFGIKTIYIESLARIETLSLSGKLIYPVVDRLYVQWPELADKYGKAHFRGAVI